MKPTDESVTPAQLAREAAAVHYETLWNLVEMTRERSGRVSPEGFFEEGKGKVRRELLDLERRHLISSRDREQLNHLVDLVCYEPDGKSHYEHLRVAHTLLQDLTHTLEYPTAIAIASIVALRVDIEAEHVDHLVEVSEGDAPAEDPLTARQCAVAGCQHPADGLSYDLDSTRALSEVILEYAVAGAWSAPDSDMGGVVGVITNATQGFIHLSRLHQAARDAKMLHEIVKARDLCDLMQRIGMRVNRFLLGVEELFGIAGLQATLAELFVSPRLLECARSAAPNNPLLAAPPKNDLSVGVGSLLSETEMDAATHCDRLMKVLEIEGYKGLIVACSLFSREQLLRILLRLEASLDFDPRVGWAVLETAKSKR